MSTDTEGTGTTTTRRGRRSSGGADTGVRVLEEQVPREVREAIDAGRPATRSLADAQEAGYLGDPVDPRPNSAYTVAGEAERQALAAEGKSIDRAPSVEQVGPARSLGEQVAANG
jgi:hypothetical protein